MISEAKTKIADIEGNNKSDVKMPTTVKEFEAWLLQQPQLADKRFEFLDGVIKEKTSMKQDELFIVRFLLQLFCKTNAFKNNDLLSPEADSHITPKRKRIADLAYFTSAQIKEARAGNRLTSAFAIEILSPNEILGDIEEKIQAYFSAGTQVVWYISPKRQHIYRYTSPTQVSILKGDDICSATPVLPDFSFPVKDMFL